MPSNNEYEHFSDWTAHTTCEVFQHQTSRHYLLTAHHGEFCSFSLGSLVLTAHLYDLLASHHMVFVYCIHASNCSILTCNKYLCSIYPQISSKRRLRYVWRLEVVVILFRRLGHQIFRALRFLTDHASWKIGAGSPRNLTELESWSRSTPGIQRT